MTKNFYLLIFLFISFIFRGYAQDSYLTAKSEEQDKTYAGGAKYEVKTFSDKFKAQKPKNIILLIGDGMGTAHVFAGMTANGGHLFLENFKICGFSRTQSSSNYITDSAAGGTALSCGVRTYNGAIGVGPDKQPLKTILEESEENGLATGLVSTSAITHATPASFIAHQASRSSYEDIASDFLKTDIDVFIGGGYNHFAKRKDNKNLLNELKSKGYQVERELDKIGKIKKGKLAGLTADEHEGRVEIRKDMLPRASQTAINILSNNKKGFFLMIEGSQIDWGAHAKNTVYVVEEMLDFDKAIGKAVEFAAKDGKTLVIVTADHETGGLSLLDGNFESGMVKGEFTSSDHTAVMVPVFAFGPGAELFGGIMDNTEIYKKMKSLLFNK